MRFGTQIGGAKIMNSLALVLGCALLAVVPTPSQRGTTIPTPPPPAAPNSAASRGGYTDPNVFNTTGPIDMGHGDDQSMRMMRLNARRDEIKKHMEQNAKRLLLLTAELRADLQTREPTEADGKRLDEIARLAHSVREQMKQ